MITEKRFAGSHHAFWRELLPMGEHYIRTTNLKLVRYCKTLDSASESRFHGIVNELAFRLFVKSATQNLPTATLTKKEIADSLSDAVRFIESFRQHGRGHPPTPRDTEVQEAIVLAQRTTEFFDQAAGGPLILQPVFPGCGWLSECEGDVLSSNVLYEIKSGARAFRMLDVKQLLVYCALNLPAQSYDIQDLCLVNPREGIFFSKSLNQICELIAGRSAVEVLGDIVEYVSDAASEDGTG